MPSASGSGFSAAPLIHAVNESSVKPQVTLTGDSGREKTIDVVVSNPLNSALVVSETYSPGWRAYIRPLGAQIRIRNSRLSSRLMPRICSRFSFPVQGAWTVRLVYSPQSFQLGMFTSFISAVLIVLALGIWLWRLLMGAAHEANADGARRPQQRRADHPQPVQSRH